MNLPTRVKALARYIPKPQTVHGATADLLALGGAALIVVGIRDIYRPAGFVFAGAFLLLFSFAMTKGAR